MKIFNTQNIVLLKKSLDVYSREHEAIAKNIANANNPDYKKEKTDFSELLSANMERKLKVSNPRHIANPEPVPPSDNRNSDGTPVDISEEMGKLAENQIRYDFSTRVLQRAYRGIFAAITGRTG